MSLLSILLYLEGIYDAKLVLRDGELWFIPVGGSLDAPDEAEPKPGGAGGAEAPGSPGK
jgi:hypothetical protein